MAPTHLRSFGMFRCPPHRNEARVPDSPNYLSCLFSAKQPEPLRALASTGPSKLASSLRPPPDRGYPQAQSPPTSELGGQPTSPQPNHVTWQVAPACPTWPTAGKGIVPRRARVQKP